MKFLSCPLNNTKVRLSKSSRPKVAVPLSAYHIHTAWNLHNIVGNGIKYIYIYKKKKNVLKVTYVGSVDIYHLCSRRAVDSHFWNEERGWSCVGFLQIVTRSLIREIFSVFVQPSCSIFPLRLCVFTTIQL